MFPKKKIVFLESFFLCSFPYNVVCLFMKIITSLVLYRKNVAYAKAGKAEECNPHRKSTYAKQPMQKNCINAKVRDYPWEQQIQTFLLLKKFCFSDGLKIQT